MSEMILNSNYDSLKNQKYNSEYIALKWSDLLRDEKFIMLNPNNRTKMVRLLLDRYIDTENDSIAISRINSLFELKGDMGFHINVEDQRCFEKAKKVANQVNSSFKSIRLFPDILLKDRTSLDLSNLSCLTILPNNMLCGIISLNRQILGI